MEEGAPKIFNSIQTNGIVRKYSEEMTYINRITPWKYQINKGFVPNMLVDGFFYVNKPLEELLFEELATHCNSGGYGGFLPAVKQIANVAALPGIVKGSFGMPDVHSGYGMSDIDFQFMLSYVNSMICLGFAVGNVAAFDMDDPTAIVSPGGVGFDINCGIRLLRTNLHVNDIEPVKEQLAQSLFDHIPVGVGSKGVIPTKTSDLEEALEMGMDWSIREGYAWAEDKEHCEEFGNLFYIDKLVDI